MKRNYLGHFFLIAIVFIFALSAVTSNGIPGLNANWSLGVSVLEQKRQEEADRWIRELYEQKFMPGSIEKSVFSAPEFQDFSALTLEPLADFFTRTSDAEFNEQYTAEDLYPSGILRSNSIAPHLLSWAEGRDPVFYHTGLIYTADFSSPVLDKLGIGSSFRDVIAQLGEPQFQDEDHCYIGYKTEDYYIAFRSTVNNITAGGSKEPTDLTGILVDRIYLEKRYALPEYLKDILTIEEDFFFTPRFWTTDSGTVEADPFLYYDTQFYRGGWNRGYLFGMDVDTYSRSFVLWADFEGELPVFDRFGKYTVNIPSRQASSSLNTRQISYVYEMDFPEWRIFAQCQWEEYLANMFATEGVATADGTKAAVAIKNTVYEHARVWIRSLTGDFPDRCFSGGHYTEKLAWLDNRYLLCQVYLQDQPFLYDFETDTGLYFYESTDLPDLLFEPGESFQIISVDKDEKQILLSHCDSLNKEIRKLTLHYDFDESGSILFTDLID